MAIQSLKKRRRAPYLDEGSWHLDKRVPVSLIIALVVQTGGMFWWASGVSSTLQNQQTQIAELKQEGRQMASRFDELIRVGSELSALKESVQRVERALEKLQPRRH